jgi:hypothetical protein
MKQHYKAKPQYRWRTELRRGSVTKVFNDAPDPRRGWGQFKEEQQDGAESEEREVKALEAPSQN